MTYRAPVSEIRFLLDHVVGFADVAAQARFADATPDMVDAILTGAAKLAEDVLAPLNRAGDKDPARLENGVVRTSAGFADGYRALAEGGWVSLSASPEHGGAGLPVTLASAVNELFSASCLALQLNPLLTQGQIEALSHHASPELQALYLPKLISGQWQGTMNLTEPQAGSDVGALTSKAEHAGDGTYRITGQKIYITWGDADFAQNVIHLVLARLPDGAAGTKGISLFLVPRHLPDAGGNPGARNSLRVVSLEHKLGIHGSPTCVMQYDGATGWLVGEKHGGMAAMFTMMNNARLGVAMQGVGVADAAFQHAASYALGRVQGRTGDAAQPAIFGHADVRRMLAEMKAQVFSARAISMACAVAIDMAHATGKPDWQARAALLTPIAKAYATDTAVAVASEGVQVHGGMGFVEETGAAQYLRDARITPIYEGTNGIQALDLVTRKLADGGEAALSLLAEAGSQAKASPLPELGAAVARAADDLARATRTLLAQDAATRGAAAVAYLRAFALTLGAHYHLRAAVADPAHLPLARVAILRLLPEYAALIAQIELAGADIAAIDTDALFLTA